MTKQIKNSRDISQLMSLITKAECVYIDGYMYTIEGDILETPDNIIYVFDADSGETVPYDLEDEADFKALQNADFYELALIKEV